MRSRAPGVEARVHRRYDGRRQVLLQLLYEPDAVLPYECRTLDSGGLDKEDRDELATATGVFLEQPLAQAFAEAFQ